MLLRQVDGAQGESLSECTNVSGLVTEGGVSAGSE